MSELQTVLADVVGSRAMYEHSRYSVRQEALLRDLLHGRAWRISQSQWEQDGPKQYTVCFDDGQGNWVCVQTFDERDGECQFDALDYALALSGIN